MADEAMVARADIAALPAEFGPAAVLLDVREHDEWQRGRAAGTQSLTYAAHRRRAAHSDR